MTLMYNGIQYEIENEGEIESINMEDDEIVEIDTAVISDGTCETSWKPYIVHLFLDECIKCKTDLHDPKVRRRQFFSTISDRMKENGHIFRIESLNRKLRNLKIHYMLMEENNSKSMRRRHWPYYDKMKTLYSGYLSQKRLKDTTPANFTHPTIVVEPYLPTDVSISSQSSPLPSPPAHKIFKPALENNHFSNHDLKGEDISSIKENPCEIDNLRRKILHFEQRRTVAAEKILDELREANRLKRELLEISIKMFKVTREMEED